jgi:hypothetical protein
MKRFHHLGFDRQRKSWLGLALGTVLATQADGVRRAMGGLTALVDLGVIDRRQARFFLDDEHTETGRQFRHDWSWTLLNLEAWARAHT